jgi:hypothetical protein
VLKFYSTFGYGILSGLVVTILANINGSGLRFIPEIILSDKNDAILIKGKLLR